MRQLKAWQGQTFHESEQVTAIIVAPTKKRAMEIGGLYRSFFDVYWSESVRDASFIEQGEGMWVRPIQDFQAEYVSVFSGTQKETPDANR